MSFYYGLIGVYLTAVGVARVVLRAGDGWVVYAVIEVVLGVSMIGLALSDYRRRRRPAEAQLDSAEEQVGS